MAAAATSTAMEAKKSRLLLPKTQFFFKKRFMLHNVFVMSTKCAKVVILVQTPCFVVPSILQDLFAIIIGLSCQKILTTFAFLIQIFVKSTKFG